MKNPGSITIYKFRNADRFLETISKCSGPVYLCSNDSRFDIRNDESAREIFRSAVSTNSKVKFYASADDVTRILNYVTAA